LSLQWFVSVAPLAKAAGDAVRDGRVRVSPPEMNARYFGWVDDMHDWCISRQLWWGHRIPVWYGPDGPDGSKQVRCVGPDETPPEGWTQDSDVLDTWFSSALWPFATLGWPDETEDLRTFYPTNMNCTAREIIFLWVSRMIMTGLEFMGEVPFADVAIHCQVQAADGRRMSKSLGTGVDPRKIVDVYGADALRAWAASVAMSSQDVRYDESRVEGYRRFCNKLWNAVKPVLTSLDGGEPHAIPEPEKLVLYEDRWILSKLAAACEAIARGIEEFAFQDSINAAYAFAWNEFCDWWLEAAKPRLKASDPVAQAIGVYCLDVLMRALHPFMPFVTEELWSRLPGERDFLMRSDWPDGAGRYIDAQVELDFESLMAMVSEIRSYRKSVSGAPAKGGAVKLDVEWDDDWVQALTRIGDVAVADKLPPGKALGLAGGSVVFPQVETADAAVTERKVAQLLKDLERIETKLANEQFIAKAPPEEVAKQKSRADEVRAAIDRLT